MFSKPLSCRRFRQKKSQSQKTKAMIIRNLLFIRILQNLKMWPLLLYVKLYLGDINEKIKHTARKRNKTITFLLKQKKER